MKLLLDTHAVLWWLAGDKRLGGTAERAIDDEANLLLLSAAVVWEVAVKRSMGKLSVTDDYLSLLLAGGLRPLAINLQHAAGVEKLPWHHRDPFDRMLIAQASFEGAAIVSRDESLRPYGVTLVW